MRNQRELEKELELEKMLESERKEGFISGVLFVLFSISAAFIAWFIVFAPFGWWIN